MNRLIEPLIAPPESPSTAVPIHWLRPLVPRLTERTHKGQAGKIGVLGGSFEYTGAPFFAAMAALKLGADLSHIFCDEHAAAPIKSYSPELIVHGCLKSGAADAAAQAAEVTRWFPALTALVVGPGLGRDPTLQKVAQIVVEEALKIQLPIVLDADGMRLIHDLPTLLHGQSWVVLTPNVAEYRRLLEATLPDWQPVDTVGQGSVTEDAAAGNNSSPTPPYPPRPSPPRPSPPAPLPSPPPLPPPPPAPPR